ncbi:MAG: T9SS type A sorting domain-containing protein, partial [Bacteroidales bacterium]
TGATITGTSNNITISFSSAATAGNLSVKGNNSCGDGVVSANFPITINPLPDAASSISSINNDSVSISENNVLYTVPVIAGATTYIWDYTGVGATFIGGNITTSDSVRINFSAIATSGFLTVKGNNTCGDGVISANYPIYVSSVGISEIEKSVNYRIYPNPTKGLICIEIDFLSEKSELIIYNLQGETIFNEMINKSKKQLIMEINLNSFPKGIYFVKIKNDKFIKVKKLILQ